jgi:AmmeMemoRadiSam system protein B
VRGGHPEKSELDVLRKAARAVADVVGRNPRVAVVGTTDYTHAGPGFREVPPSGGPIAAYIRGKDAQFLSMLCPKSYPERQADAFAPHAVRGELPGMGQLYERGKHVSMCGLGTTLLCNEIARLLGCRHARVLRYAVGSDISKRDLSDQTGFASVAFE